LKKTTYSGQHTGPALGWTRKDLITGHARFLDHCINTQSMRLKPSYLERITILVVILTLIMACNQDNIIMKKGSYGYDMQFLKENKIDFIELTGQDSLSKLIIVPSWQGRIMTSTANGDEGNSNGWINYDFIKEGKVSKQFNVYGGEERFWIGPEGGKYSIYFNEGEEQVFENWKVPAFIDTEAYPVIDKTSSSVTMESSAILKNASGTTFEVKIRRDVKVLNASDIEEGLGFTPSANLKMMGYQSDNLMTNIGSEEWTREGGLLSIWMLCMFTPSPSVTVFIPYDNNPDYEDIPFVNDEYFGKVPPERLGLTDEMIYFRIDGNYRSKIGIPKERAGNFCGSYDEENKMLTVIWFNKPATNSPYVNSNWGSQDDPYNGDVVNSYNDGPLEDGSIMGPFYEIETSSPGAELQNGQSIMHTQRVYHFEGEEEILEPITLALFGLSITEIKTKFKSKQ